jgi:hypothetical protein
MGPNDAAARRVEIPMPVISANVELARLAGGSSAVVPSRLTSLRCYGPREMRFLLARTMG